MLRYKYECICRCGELYMYEFRVFLLHHMKMTNKSERPTYYFPFALHFRAIYIATMRAGDERKDESLRDLERKKIEGD